MVSFQEYKQLCKERKLLRKYSNHIVAQSALDDILYHNLGFKNKKLDARARLNLETSSKIEKLVLHSLRMYGNDKLADKILFCGVVRKGKKKRVYCHSPWCKTCREEKYFLTQFGRFTDRVTHNMTWRKYVDDDFNNFDFQHLTIINSIHKVDDLDDVENGINKSREELKSVFRDSVDNKFSRTYLIGTHELELIDFSRFSELGSHKKKTLSALDGFEQFKNGGFGVVLHSHSLLMNPKDFDLSSVESVDAKAEIISKIKSKYTAFKQTRIENLWGKSKFGHDMTTRDNVENILKYSFKNRVVYNLKWSSGYGGYGKFNDIFGFQQIHDLVTTYDKLGWKGLLINIRGTK